MLHRNCFVLLAVLASLTLGVAADPKEEPALKISTQEQMILDETNAVRKKENRAPVKPNARLFAAARAHTLNMAKQRKEEHELDGKDPGKRIDDAKYNWESCGENLGWMSKFDKSTVGGLFKRWLASPAHRKELLGEFEETGIGVVPGKGPGPENANKDGFWITQVFATKQK